MTVIVTRPEPDGSILAARLETLGYSPVQCPLMNIVFHDGPALPSHDYQALLITSANGLRALEAASQTARFSATPVIAVGPASARLARSLGFADVCQAGGNVDALADLVSRNLIPDAGPLLYITGKSRAGDLKGKLETLSFDVDRVELYQAVPAESLPEAVLKSLNEGTTTAVLLYSPRTAHIWASLIQSVGLTGKLANVIHVCLSKAVADVIYSDLKDNLTIAVASNPTDDAMLKALANT